MTSTARPSDRPAGHQPLVPGLFRIVLGLRRACSVPAAPHPPRPGTRRWNPRRGGAGPGRTGLAEADDPVPPPGQGEDRRRATAR